MLAFSSFRAPQNGFIVEGKEGKNLHLEHLEDNILNGGSQGGKEAVAFLRSLGEMLEQGGADTRVTVKWDGAPAIICGVNPDNGRFFVGTKSVVMNIINHDGHKIIAFIF